MPTIYGIPNCDSCRKARKWLDANSIDHTFHDLRADGLSKRDVTRWLKTVAWDKLLNTRSTTWRGLDDSVRSDLGEQKAIALLLEHPTLVKRPVLEEDGDVLVGFDAERYATLLSK